MNIPNTPLNSPESVLIVDIPNEPGLPMDVSIKNETDDDINQRVERGLERDGNPVGGIPSLDMNSMEQHLVVSFKKLRERVIIYEYLCYSTSNYYNRWNKGLLVPSIMLSSMLALVNSNLGETDFAGLKVFNVVSNGALTMLIAIQNAFKFAERADYFFNLKKKFTKLHNGLNNNIISQIASLKIDQEQLLEHMKEYDNLDENILYEFPRHIVVRTRNRFEGYSMPTICNGISVEENDVQPRKSRKRYSIPDPIAE